MKNFTITIIWMIISFNGLTPLLNSQTVNQDEKTVTVTAQGWGKKIDDTRTNALKTGVEAVIMTMLSTPEEQKKFRENRSAFLENTGKYLFDYRIIRKLQQRGERDGKKYHLTLTLEIIINKELLRNDLEKENIISALDVEWKKLGFFSIIPYVDEKNSSPDFLRQKSMIFAKIGSYLQNQGVPIIGEDEIARINDMEEAINMGQSASAENGEEELMLQLARNTPADFYIKISGAVTESLVEGITCYKVSLSINVYTIMTGEYIASQTGFSRALSLSSQEISVAAGIEDAVNATMPDVLIKLRKFWTSYVANGRPYMLVFYDYDFSEAAQIRAALMANGDTVKLMMRAGNITSFLLWSKISLDELIFTIPGKIDLNLKDDPVVLGNSLRFFRKTKK